MQCDPLLNRSTPQNKGNSGFDIFHTSSAFLFHHNDEKKKIQRIKLILSILQNNKTKCENQGKITPQTSRLCHIFWYEY